ncbi:MAG: DegV family protein [Firmicutes bacterium]|nr:DegV family protein [Bacillota bacterium]
MERKFILSCESTVDLPFSYVDGRDMPVLFYTYAVDGVDYVDDMGRDPEALPRFYQMLKDGALPTTSQINEYKYEQFLEELLQKGDVLHIAMGTGMSNSVNNAFAAAEQLRAKYPERKLVVIDSLCSSSGYGMLVDDAADLRDEGKSIEEVEEWVLAHRQKIHHQFYSTDLSFFRRSGRVSGSAAAVGAILNICPIMRLDDGGRIIAYDKVRGKKKAVRTTIETMEAHAEKGVDYDGKCWICHSNSPEDAEVTKAAVAEHFPHISGEIRICDIGTIIASHCGPGTLAVFFMGDERQPDQQK